MNQPRRPTGPILRCIERSVLSRGRTGQWFVKQIRFLEYPGVAAGRTEDTRDRRVHRCLDGKYPGVPAVDRNANQGECRDRNERQQSNYHYPSTSQPFTPEYAKAYGYLVLLWARFCVEKRHFGHAGGRVSIGTYRVKGAGPTPSAPAKVSTDAFPGPRCDRRARSHPSCLSRKWFC